MKHFIGMNKFGHHASACLLSQVGGESQTELFLKERLTRVRGDRGSIEIPLKKIRDKVNFRNAKFCENSYLDAPHTYESRRNEVYPYFEHLKSQGLELSTREYNSKIEFLGHHLCHATAALSVSPFRKALIAVFDGTGSLHSAFPKGDLEANMVHGLRTFVSPLSQKNKDKLSKTLTESITVYSQNGGRLEPTYKYWQLYNPRQSRKGLGLNDETLYGFGAFYSMISKYIFGDTLDAGKVMGLAPFGRPMKVKSALEFVRELDWSKAFVKPKRGAKEAWQKSRHMKLYRDLAATVQSHFESEVMKFLEFIKSEYPDYENLILTGGCALNCVSNWKILQSGLFKSIYVPPFPGDESISLGAAKHLQYRNSSAKWRPTSMKSQICNFGPRDSAPENYDIEKVFREFSIMKPKDICSYTAQEISDGKIIAWFQGRSESGPRALGYRSILANPLAKGMKDKINERIKRRESFRPFAPSCLHEKVGEYFEVAKGFESPFMSFAPPVRSKFKNRLTEVAHVDATARLQTVRKEANPKYHRLISKVGDITGVYCVLNTSLNVMGEAIVETPEDAKRFLESSQIDGLAIGDYFIRRVQI